MIEFNQINVNEGLLYFYFVINGKKYENHNDKKNNKIYLNKIGIKYNTEMSLFPADDVSFKIAIKIFTDFGKYSYEQRKYSPNKNVLEDNISFKDKIKIFSGGNDFNYRNPARESTRPLHVHRKLESFTEKINNQQNSTKNVPQLQNNIDIERSKTQIYNPQMGKFEEPIKKMTLNIPQKNDKKEEKTKIKNNKAEQPPQNIKNEDNKEMKESKDNRDKENMENKDKKDNKYNKDNKDSKVNREEKEKQNEPEKKEYFLDGITYEKYLSKLTSQNKKEHESGRESFCEGFFIASFPQKEGKVIENSQSFPSPCGHSECSLLPAMKPEIIARYPLKDTKTLELNNLAATICFPTGIKVCYSEESPSMIKDYVTPITNQKGERYYMMTYHFYHKVMNDIYSKLYEMHPLKHPLMKFGDSYLNMSEEEMDENIVNQIQESLEKSQELGFRDYVYVPYCICLISKYPYVTEMKKCLQSIYSLIINHLTDNKPDLNNLIMYFIHSVPIP